MPDLEADLLHRLAQQLARWQAAQFRLAHRRSNLGSRRATVARGKAELAHLRSLGEPAAVMAEFEALVNFCADYGVPDPARLVTKLNGRLNALRRQTCFLLPAITLAGLGCAAMRPGATNWPLWITVTVSAALAAGVSLAGIKVLRRLARAKAALRQGQTALARWRTLMEWLDAANRDEFKERWLVWAARADQLELGIQELKAIEMELEEQRILAEQSAAALEQILAPAASELAGAGPGLEARARAFMARLQHTAPDGELARTCPSDDELVR